MRRFLRAALAVALFAAPVCANAATGVSLLTGPLDPSGTLSTLNGLINTMNSTYAPSGGQSLNSTIFTVGVTSGVNLFSMAPGATTVAPILSVGGDLSDTNIGIVVAGKGSGHTCLGGSTCINSSFEAITAATVLNKLVATGGATGVAPSLVTGGASVETNVGMFIAGNGTGPVYIGGTTTTLAGLQVAQTASRVNSIVVTPTATGTVPSIGVGGAGADATRNLNLLGAGANGIVVLGPTVATCSGTTTATCQGQRFVASVTGLSTAAAGTTSTAMTVTNASVVASSSQVLCNVSGYVGTGLPLVSGITPGTGTVAFTITNVAGSGSLNATVPVACEVIG